jgi:hypothetical protein
MSPKQLIILVTFTASTIFASSNAFAQRSYRPEPTPQENQSEVQTEKKQKKKKKKRKTASDRKKSKKKTKYYIEDHSL